MAPPSAPMIRVSGVDLNIGLAPGGFLGRRIRQLSWLKGFGLLTTSKPVKCYNRKMRDSIFLNVEDSLIVEAVSTFCALPLSSGAVTSLVQS
jgi:hypothetical protein